MAPPHDDPSFLKEVWGLYIVGTTLLLLRSITRLRMVGIRGLQGDDWMTFVVLLCYTVDAVTVTITYQTGTNLDFTQAQLQAMTTQEQSRVIYGSRIELLAWYTYTGLIWALKATMLFFFNRLTLGLRSHNMVRIMSIITGVCYVAVFLTVTLGCYPTHKNWQILPDPGVKCTLKIQNFYVTTILNVLTDAAILCIPLPLLWNLQVSISKKIGLALLFSSGIFVITAAIIRIVLTLSPNASALLVNRWGVRETIVGIIAVNIPILRPLFSKRFWTRGFSSSSSRTPISGGLHSHTPHHGSKPLTSLSTRGDAYELSGTNVIRSNSITKSTTPIVHDVYDNDHRAETSSQESIINKHGGAPGEDGDLEQGIGGVMVETSYDIRTERVDEPSSRLGIFRNATDRKWGSRNHGNHIKIEGGNKSTD